MMNRQSYFAHFQRYCQEIRHNVLISIIAWLGWPGWKFLHRMADRALVAKEGGDHGI
jgi:hypothetical protein